MCKRLCIKENEEGRRIGWKEPFIEKVLGRPVGSLRTKCSLEDPADGLALGPLQAQSLSGSSTGRVWPLCVLDTLAFYILSSRLSCRNI